MRRRGEMHLRAVALVVAIDAGAVTATSIDGEAAYRERIAPPADECTVSAITQAALGKCAYQAFLAASATLSTQLQRLESGLPAPRKAAWWRLQKSWLAYRTEACNFESGAGAGGSVQPMLQWRCATRTTRARAAELAQAADCREGDPSCTRPVR